MREIAAVRSEKRVEALSELVAVKRESVSVVSCEESTRSRMA